MNPFLLVSFFSFTIFFGVVICFAAPRIREWVVVRNAPHDPRLVVRTLAKIFKPTQAVSCLLWDGDSLIRELRMLGIPANAIWKERTGRHDFYKAVRVCVNLTIPTEDGLSLEMTDRGLRIAAKEREIPDWSREYWKSKKGSEMASKMILFSDGHTEYFS